MEVVFVMQTSIYMIRAEMFTDKPMYSSLIHATTSFLTLWFYREQATKWDAA